MGKARKQAVGVAYAIVGEVRDPATDAGAAVAGTQVRELNTKLHDSRNIVSFGPGTGEFILGPGSYLVEWSAPAFMVNRHKASLHAASGEVYEGYSSYSSDSDVYAQTVSTGSALFDLVSQDTFSIKHYTQVGKTDNGLGISPDNGNDAIYTTVTVTKLS